MAIIRQEEKWYEEGSHKKYNQKIYCNSAGIFSCNVPVEWETADECTCIDKKGKRGLEADSLNELETKYDDFLKGTDYNDNESVETWNVLINYQNKVNNIIICQTNDVFHKWKFATMCLINLCRNEKMKYLLMNNKEKRVDLFKQFKEMFRLGFIEEIPY